jgi:hypothetical protein
MNKAFGTMVCVAVTFAILVGGTFGMVAGCGEMRDYKRHQKFKDAVNNTKITKQKILTAKQEAQIVAAHDATIQAKADQRVIEAKGIKAAQALINNTLTPLYVQHEAIQAQEHDPGRTVYIPVGPQGVPLVNNLNDGVTNKEGK